MIIELIIVGILISALVILSAYMGRSKTCDFDTGVIMGGIIATLMAFEVFLLSNIIGTPTPSALDVYRGNTKLEVTSVNGIPTDTVVVFKN